MNMFKKKCKTIRINNMIIDANSIMIVKLHTTGDYIVEIAYKNCDTLRTTLEFNTAKGSKEAYDNIVECLLQR